MDDEQEESLFRRFEAWSLDYDLHIWYGFISVIALCVLVFIVDKEFNRSAYLGSQVISLQEDVKLLRVKNQDLVIEMENQRQVYLTSSVPAKASSDVDKAANKVSDKINKVQDVLIDKASQTKVIRSTETTFVSTPTVVNKELNTMMMDSYCSTVPDHTQCKDIKKK